jgi:hypothetical protein
LDTPGTVAGLRRWVLLTAPIAPGIRADAPTKAVRSSEPRGQIEPPPAETPTPAGGVTPGETKRDALIRLYERCGETGDPRYGDRTKTAALAGEIAAQIGYHPGTARRELAKYLATRAHAGQPPRSETATDAKAVA